MANQPNPGGRRYAGLDPAERARHRRAALLDAAQELFGDRGYQATSVKQLCAHAGLTERYFYESFRDREAALTAVYDKLVDGLRATTLASVAEHADSADMARRGLDAFIGFLVADQRRARIVLVEVVGVSAALEARRHAVLTEFAELLAEIWLGDVEASTRRRLTTIALVGAVNHLLVDWLLSGRTRRPEELVQACAALFAGARDRLVADD